MWHDLKSKYGVSCDTGIGCYGAVASTPGTTSWYNGYSIGSSGDGVIGLKTLIHELGHNLGLHHSSFTASDTNSEYGDESDIMGHGKVGGCLHIEDFIGCF